MIRQLRQSIFMSKFCLSCLQGIDSTNCFAVDSAQFARPNIPNIEFNSTWTSSSLFQAPIYHIIYWAFLLILYQSQSHSKLIKHFLSLLNNIFCIFHVGCLLGCPASQFLDFSAFLVLFNTFLISISPEITEINYISRVFVTISWRITKNNIFSFFRPCFWTILFFFKSSLDHICFILLKILFRFKPRYFKMELSPSFLWVKFYYSIRF